MLEHDFCHFFCIAFGKFVHHGITKARIVDEYALSFHQ